MASDLRTLLLEGISYQREGRYPEAIELYHQALAQSPGNIHALNALGMALADLGRIAEALATFEQAAQAAPQELLTWQNMARVHLSQTHYDKAESCYRQALRYSPGNPELLRLLARASVRQDKTGEAKSALSQITGPLASSPVLALERLHLAPTVWDSNEAIDRWREETLQALDAIPPMEITRHLPELYGSDAGIDFRILCHGRNNRDFRERYAQQFTCAYPARFRHNDSAVRKVGIFVSAYFENVFLKILHGMLNQWEDDGVEISVICHPSGREKFRRLVHNPRIRYVLVGEDLAGITETVRAEGLDLVYFWEVGSNSPNYFLPMLRLAHLQCTSWGSVETTGLSQIDYFISSRLQESDDPQPYYTEQVYLLDHVPACFPRPPSALYTRFSRADFSFAEADRLYVLPHHLWKLHPDIDTAVASILLRDPKAIVVFVQGVIPRLTGALKARLEKCLPPAARERVRFLPYQGYDGYLSLLAQADVVLDTLHYSGGQTSMETLAAGTPVITMPGEAMRSRSTHACYRAMKMEQAGTVASDAADYVEKALALGTDPAARKRLSQQIMDCNHVLYDNPRIAEDHARFFRYAVDRLRAGSGVSAKRG